MFTVRGVKYNFIPLHKSDINLKRSALHIGSRKYRDMLMPTGLYPIQWRFECDEWQTEQLSICRIEQQGYQLQVTADNID